MFNCACSTVYVLMYCVCSYVLCMFYCTVYVLMLYSMSGGELFDRIQKKGHFTERGDFPFVCAKMFQKRPLVQIYMDSIINI